MARLRGRAADRRDLSGVDLSTQVAGLQLPGCLMAASGTAGFGSELRGYVDYSTLAAIVTKSLSAFEWPGNPAPRVVPTTAGMLNSVGLQGRGIEYWIETTLPELRTHGAPVVVSIWGRTVDEYADAAAALRAVAADLTAIEINLSCPNLVGKALFAHDPVAAAEVVAAADIGVPRWAKLSANTDRTVEVATSVRDAGAAAVVLINTLMGMAIDIERRTPKLGAIRGGLSGAAIHSVAVRTVWDVATAVDGLAIVGVGGVSHGTDAIELMMAGASAVQVGTASFADPRALTRINNEVQRWCVSRGVSAIRDLVGSAHP